MGMISFLRQNPTEAKKAEEVNKPVEQSKTENVIVAEVKEEPAEEKTETTTRRRRRN